MKGRARTSGDDCGFRRANANDLIGTGVPASVRGAHRCGPFPDNRSGIYVLIFPSAFVHKDHEGRRSEVPCSSAATVFGAFGFGRTPPTHSVMNDSRGVHCTTSRFPNTCIEVAQRIDGHAAERYIQPTLVAAVQSIDGSSTMTVSATVVMITAGSIRRYGRFPTLRRKNFHMASTARPSGVQWPPRSRSAVSAVSGGPSDHRQRQGLCGSSSAQHLVTRHITVHRDLAVLSIAPPICIVSWRHRNLMRETRS